MSIYGDGNDELEQWHPQWLMPLEQQPYQLNIENDPLSGAIVVRLRTPRVAVSCQVVDPELVETASAQLVGQLKGLLVKRYGLHEAVVEDYHRKLICAAAYAPPADRNAVLAFLVSLSIDPFDAR